MTSMNDTISKSRAVGRVRTYAVMPDESATLTSDWIPNLVTNNWGHIMAQLLAGEDQFRIGSVYLEFENTANPGDSVAAPELSRARDIDYYNGLSSSPTRDYLRVDLTARTLVNSDESVFTRENAINFFARTSGVVGVHGKPFSHNDNSVIFGGSLVSTPVVNDATRDVVFSSFYFPEDEQVPKVAFIHFGLDWEITFS